MNPNLREMVMVELRLRGYTIRGESPQDTMVLSEAYIEELELADLLDMMITRREKIFRLAEGERSTARASFDDVVLAVEAIKVVIGRIVASSTS